MQRTSLFIFHRDLNIDDNPGLLECLESSDVTHLAFIFTPEQANPTINKYFSTHSFGFMLWALARIAKKTHISFFYEQSRQCIKRLIKELHISQVWENADFTPFARSRQKEHRAICEAVGVEYVICDSITLLPMGTLLKKTGKSYTKFTPFYTNALRFRIPAPVTIPASQLRKVSAKKPSKSIALSHFKSYNLYQEPMPISSLFKLFEKKAAHYEDDRDYMDVDAGSHFGSYLHFGVVSPRLVYARFKSSEEFIRQLYWREFYMYIVNYIVLSNEKKSWTLPRFNAIKWATNATALKQWQRGETGIPIVDAGMRQLLQTGHMHNRARMICAMYLIHFLHIHWKEGEQWFARNLTDYSYANNYGGWVWCAGIEVYANPYFRIYSMEQQNKRFDPQCEYVKKWCVELRDATTKEIMAKYAGLDTMRADRIRYLKKIT